ncbi:Alpha/Beta hydrolase protein [Desarmillaria tabescens]|uniref:Alpha/Beta hydrolase protein n=1 Tax=Armillaria tabescens TaxID=1929756 RepID=A0AA39KGX4_ARMTA|nr:Alpha/Beta hydrolase protein [Desarmillaria tabescens]KAK0459701.1 Alpha/Beta hydrolase protein [Desarmillaria tabescens]
MQLENLYSLLTLPFLVGLSAFFTAATQLFAPKARTPIVVFPHQPSHVVVKKGASSADGDKLSLKSLVLSRCRSLFSEYKSTWWLPNGHLQTAYSVTADFTKTDKMYYNRQYIRLLDGGTLGLDFAPVDSSQLKPDTPIIVVQHGLTGGSYEAYVRAILYPACTPVEEGGLGYRAVVINFRGCAGVPITSSMLYSAGHTDDLRQALFYISHTYPEAPLLGLGFSLGANIMTRYISEEGPRCRLTSGCALACPWDLAQNNEQLLSSFIGKHVYAKGLGTNLLNLVKRHQTALLAKPNDRILEAMAAVLALKNPTLRDFDHAFSRIASGPPPSFPYVSAEAYYDGQSSHHAVKDIHIPFLSINSADDPIVRSVPMDGGGNGFVMMALTPGGGHLGWFQSGASWQELNRWTTQPVLEWMRMAGEMVVGDICKSRPLQVDADGWIKEQGVNHLGCKVAESGGTIDGNVVGDGTMQGL